MKLTYTEFRTNLKKYLDLLEKGEVVEVRGIRLVKELLSVKPTPEQEPQAPRTLSEIPIVLTKMSEDAHEDNGKQWRNCTKCNTRMFSSESKCDNCLTKKK